MNKHSQLIAASVVGASICLPASAGVRTLTSDEMIETYVKDSAVIIVPQDRPKKSEADRRRIIRALTIAPGEPELSEAEEEAYRQELQRLADEGKSDALERAEEEFVRRAILLPQQELAKAQPGVVDFSPNIPPIIFGEQLVIPEGPFEQTYLNDQLGLSFDGQALNFSIGSPPGIDNIQIPRGINEGPVNLTPRPGGGFDLSIQVPD
ncbi:hypothetical protein LPB19_11040 [Marinobacter salinisoli]|uniref:Uncharacterized protein n=1 Tax=Marinobacter salinisoli TaxID=2769486 RepID=A0ABX7MQS0_9GAMM|nr:hypothetical protein [Marinobacter salinisoli]QSP93734.1 hypothetical protein LPB19_11040 [Marinobacter salinisoli]